MNLRLSLTVVMLMLAMFNIPTVRAQSIESLVMPGPVIEGHAEVESQCNSCHVRFNRGRQRDLCNECHKDVGADIAASTGFHGRFPDAKSHPCAECHAEHEGRDAVIVILNEQTFDHDFTDYPLIGGHLEAECGDCHQPDAKHREAPSACIDCHRDEDPHEGFMGDHCADCHTAIAWTDVEFDHDTTGYPLIGGHREIACADCHADQTFQNAPTTCYGCHAEDDAHDGRSGQDCENCHNPISWTDTSFNHDRDTSFVLDGKHAELACGDCHSEDPFADELETSCVSCHTEDDEHKGHFGAKCETCHGTSLWTESLFDHGRDTDYALHGAHADIECVACHLEPIYDVPLESGCNDCHADDDPHEGEQGIECQECHNDSSWEDEVFFDHDLTRFPLLGKHAETDCDGCHETHVFRDAPEACTDCHAEDDPHEGRYTDDCGSCHNPVDWNAWQFDHDLLTDFPLSGAHAEVACADCHRQPLATMSRMGGRCGDCHRADDIHDGEFGPDCGRCHSADNFRDVRSIQ